jgi:hypothetical protein
MNKPPKDKFSAFATAFCVPCIHATGTGFMPLYRGYRPRFVVCHLAFLQGPPVEDRTRLSGPGPITALSSIKDYDPTECEISAKCRNGILVRGVGSGLGYPVSGWLCTALCQSLQLHLLICRSDHG